MDREKLNDALIAQGLDGRSFDVLGASAAPSAAETYVLRPIPAPGTGQPSAWATYYAEHGVKTRYREFASEEEACRFFLAWITADPTTWSAVR